jgi:hypothetical protein
MTPMVSMPLDCVRMLLDGALRPCDRCNDHVATHIENYGWSTGICEECLGGCDDDEIDGVRLMERIDAAREFNAAMDAARETVRDDHG